MKRCAVFWPLVFVAAPLLAQTPTGDEIVAKSQQAFYYAGQDMSARVVMTLITAGGQQRVRHMSEAAPVGRLGDLPAVHAERPLRNRPGLRPAGCVLTP